MTSPTDSDPIEDLLAECLCHAHASDQRAAVDQVCRERPELSVDLRARFQILVELGLNGVASGVVGPESAKRFGDFELLEVIGEGGMGIVHRARQSSLGRDVVIKLIRPELLYFGGARRRFEREAGAIARLHHPGIVPVLLVGEHEGIPFFAMEHIAGRPLDMCIAEVASIDARPLRPGDLSPGLSAKTYAAAALQIGTQVAAALHHAHQRGVLHRDVKPSNVMLSTEGRTTLIDFGLHALRPAESDGEDGDDEGVESPSRLTRTGSAPGTLLYMAPEQIEAGIYDVRSEVYALGATLYELLALRPPFRGDNRSSTERLIRTGGPPPLRSASHDVGRDVEAVIGCAMSVDPARRYVDMRAFEDDLQRLLDGRPVAARPDGALYRLRRWVGRQPLLATVAAVLLVAMIAGPAAWIVRQKEHAAGLALALGEEREARESAEDLSLYVVDVLESADPNLNEPSAAVEQILERGVTSMDARLAGRPLRRAEVQRLLGRIHGNLGMWRKAVELLEESLATWKQEYERRVQAERPRAEIAGALDEVVESRSALAWILESRHQTAEALAHRRALEQELAVLGGPESWAALHARANWMRLALESGEPLPDGEATPSLEEYQSALRTVIEAVDASVMRSPEYHASALGWLGTLLVREAQTQTPEAGRPLLVEALDYLERCIATHAECGLGETLDCATAWMSLGVARKWLGNLDGAALAYDNAITTFEKRLPPDDMRLGVALINSAGLLEARGRIPEAIERLEQAERNLELALGADSPEAVQASGNLLGVRFRAGLTDGLLPQVDALIPRQIAAFGAQDGMVAASHQNRATLRAQVGDFPGAKLDLERARGIFLPLIGEEHTRMRTLDQMLRQVTEAIDAN